MFGMTALDLARIQFAFTMSFHILFPAVTIGLASYLAVLELSWLRTKRQVYVDLYHFWLKIFAVMFGMGVVSGIVMAYQIGTNWSYMSEFAGSILGPVLAYEVLTAFFLEAGFLGVMLFGWTRVGPGLHFLATCMVAVGTLISATWILAANSWMQTPQGYAIEGNRMVPSDWLAIVFNPSFPYRLMHMVVAAYLTTALIVGATGAWQLLKRRDNPAVRKMLSMAMWMLLLVAPIQAVIGDFHGLNTAEHQPAKLAAMEGHWQNTPGEAVPLLLFGIPGHAGRENPLRGRHSPPGQRHPHALLGRADPGPEGIRAREPAEFPDRLLEFPPDGRPGPPDDRARGLEPVPAPGRAHLHDTPVPARRALDGAGGTARHPGRLGDDRGRAPALGGLRRAAHRRCGIEAWRGTAGADARPVRGGLFLRVRRRHRLRAAHDAQGPASLRAAPGHRGRAGRGAHADAADVGGGRRQRRRRHRRRRCGLDDGKGGRDGH